MKAALAILVCCSLTAGIALAQSGGPRGAPPTFATIVKTTPAKGEIVLQQLKPVEKAVEVVKKVRQNDKDVIVKEIVVVTDLVPYHLSLQATAIRFITPDGKGVPIDEVWKRLKANTVIAVSADSETPAAAYLRALHPETLVMIPVLPSGTPAEKIPEQKKP